jgi:hypothetical protein
VPLNLTARGTFRVTQRISTLLFGSRRGRLMAKRLAASENRKAWLTRAMPNSGDAAVRVSRDNLVMAHFKTTTPSTPVRR